MKRLTILLALCALAMSTSLTISAQYRSLKVHLKDQTSVTVDLASDLTVRFNDIEMIILSSTIPSKRIVLEKNTVDRFEHFTMAGTDSPGTDTTAPSISDGQLTFGNLPAGTSITIYDTAGRSVSNGNADGTSCTISLGNLQPGIYIVNVNNQSFKIAVK